MPKKQKSFWGKLMPYVTADSVRRYNGGIKRTLRKEGEQGLTELTARKLGSIRQNNSQVAEYIGIAETFLREENQSKLGSILASIYFLLNSGDRTPKVALEVRGTFTEDLFHRSYSPTEKHPLVSVGNPKSLEILSIMEKENPRLLSWVSNTVRTNFEGKDRNQAINFAAGLYGLIRAQSEVNELEQAYGENAPVYKRDNKSQ